MSNSNDQVALITGGSSGFGRATAVKLVAAGGRWPWRPAVTASGSTRPRSPSPVTASPAVLGTQVSKSIFGGTAAAFAPPVRIDRSRGLDAVRQT